MMDKPIAWARVSNISGAVRGVFEAGPDGAAPDVELRSERLVPLAFAAAVAEECAKVVDQARVDADYVAHPDAEWWVGEAAKRIREAFKP